MCIFAKSLDINSYFLINDQLQLISVWDSCTTCTTVYLTLIIFQSLSVILPNLFALTIYSNIHFWSTFQFTYLMKNITICAALQWMNMNEYIVEIQSLHCTEGISVVPGVFPLIYTRLYSSNPAVLLVPINNSKCNNSVRPIASALSDRTWGSRGEERGIRAITKVKSLNTFLFFSKILHNAD